MAQAILDTVQANGFTEDAHVRVTITRGDAPSSGMDPRLCATLPPTIVVMAESKKPPLPKSGIRLVTSSIRRTPAECLDPKLHSCNQLGQILAKMEANQAGAHEALMLDVNGFVAETNSANIFAVSGGTLKTPHRDMIMPGLTRGVVLDLAASERLQALESNISLFDIYTADEVFITGTVNQLVSVIEVDGRTIGDGQPGPATARLLSRYLQVAAETSVPVGQAGVRAVAAAQAG
jgi:branched-chain amino acid aminotransferase